MTGPIRYYSVTGVVAHERLSPLLPPEWINVTTTMTTTTMTMTTTTEDESSSDPDDRRPPPDFVWENAPRRDTRVYRDRVKVYSHLPNGSHLLDSKWALGRLLAGGRDSDSDIGALETHCFRGMEGFRAFAKRVDLGQLQQQQEASNSSSSSSSITTKYPDIMDGDLDLSSAPDPNVGPKNLWVVKDAMANGAGGIWIVGPENADTFQTEGSTPLYPEHKYVAQRYAWPPVLYGGRKCHVRVYGLFTSDGRAFVHRRAFLHVANDPFTTMDAVQTGSFQDSIHITNCCANSHDSDKFAGEILADFDESHHSTKRRRDGQTVVPLAAFFPSVSKGMAYLAHQAFPFLQGGQANHGFEYLGIDFILSYNEHRKPIAYLLEVNAPPSQDSATGLPHAENLHNEVLRDLTTLWVLPHVLETTAEIPGGWKCIHAPASIEDKGEPIIPSKAAIINMIRWNMYDKKAQKEEERRAQSAPPPPLKETMNGTVTRTPTTFCNGNPSGGLAVVSTFARSQFPFFSDAATSHPPQVFFENAGGSQVAQSVMDAMSDSLRCRHRSKVGATSKRLARHCIRRLLGAKEDAAVLLGPNATTLLASLADQYVRLGLLRHGDEVIVSTENHVANFDPWVRAAKASGATLKIWSPFSVDPDTLTRSKNLEDLLTVHTRIVAVPHVSNLLGQLRDLHSLTTRVKQTTRHYGHVIVDGVAAVPHSYADLDHHPGVDWYVLSCHKMFGPHLGALVGRRSLVQQHFLREPSAGMDDDTSLYKLLESGTINYEGCAGVIGIGRYFVSLSSFSPDGAARCLADLECGKTLSGQSHSETTTAAVLLSPMKEESTITIDHVQEAYRRIRLAEASLVEALLSMLTHSRHVRILQGDPTLTTISTVRRLPTVSFVHATLSPQTIVAACDAQGISSRCSSFLCTPFLAHDFGFDPFEGVVRFSLVHYNTLAEIDAVRHVLEGLPNWF